MKCVFTTTSVLAHYNSKLKTWVETDAFNFVIAKVLFLMCDGVLKPVAYFLKKMTPEKCNYMMYNKKPLAVIKSFKL